MPTIPSPPTHSSVPADFPRELLSGAVPGAQPKLLARKIDGNYVVGLTEDELQERYTVCEDLVHRLTPYCSRKQREHATWTETEILRKVANAIQVKQWGPSPAEISWIVGRVAENLGWSKLEQVTSPSR